MSLNCAEIDRVLGELPLAGARIEKVLQPSFDSLVLRLYTGGRDWDLLLSISHGACRLHRLSASVPKPERPLRFQECLKARVQGGTIEAATQLGDERVVRFDISVLRAEGESSRAKVYKTLGQSTRKALEDQGPELHRYRLYARLWSGAGNLVLAEATDDGGWVVVDALARRPKKGEVSGEACRVEEVLAEEAAARVAKARAGGREPAPPRVFTPRDLPAVEDREGGGSYNERIEAAYAAAGGGLSLESLREAEEERHGKRRRVLEGRIAELEGRARDFRDSGRQRELGDILMANQARPLAGPLLECEDFYQGGLVAIEVDPRLSLVDNAKAYYERYRKAGSGLADLEAELAATRASLAEEEAEHARLLALADPLRLAKALAKGGTVRAEAARGRAYPGLSLERKGWTILVGRSAKENDELLRHHVKGQDLWMHARDYAGSYVFVKAKAGKSFPLDLMVEAGNLAIYYSKGRANGGGELYYTQVKHLRRAKDGPKGLVLPSQEKNLHINLDEGLLRELKALIGEA